LTTAYPGNNYQTPTFYSGPYTGVSPNSLGYSAGQPQVNPAGQPQVNAYGQKIASKIANSGLPIFVKSNNSRRRCWVCQSERHFSSNCPSKVPRIIEIRSTDNDSKINEPNKSNDDVRTIQEIGENAVRNVVAGNKDDDLVYLEVMLNSTSGACLCDTGSQLSLIPLRFVNFENIVHKIMRIHVHSDVPIENRTGLKRLMNKYSDIFIKSEFDLGETPMG